MRRYISTLLLAAAAVGLLASCGRYEKKSNTATAGSFTMVCDDSFQNIMEQEVDVFEYQYPDAHVLVRYGTQAEALDSFLSMNTRTICIPRELTEAEVNAVKRKKNLPIKSARIAVDAVALVVNPENPADYLTLSEISDILSGETNKWIDLNPHYPDKPIAVLFDNAGSSMVQYMRDSLINGRELGPNAHAQGSIQAVIDGVRKHKEAIGVIGVSWLTSDLRKSTTIDSLSQQLADESTMGSMGDINEQISNAGVKVLGVRAKDEPRAYKPFQENIYNGTYPLTRSMYLITAAAGGPALGFYSFVTGYVGQKLIMKTGVMPARMNIEVVELMP